MGGMSAKDDGRFPATQWSLISRIHGGDDREAQRALNELCSLYHYPLYCYIRRRGLEHHDAQDALHDFFAKLLRNDSFQQLDGANGKLRGFLAKSLQRFLHNWYRDHANNRAEISIECEQELAEAEGRFQKERLSDADTPERLLERKWAGELLRQVQRKLRAQYQNKNKAVLYDALLPGLINGGSLRGEDTPSIAAVLGMSEGSLRVAMTRLLDDYRIVLRQEVAQTVEREEDVEDEIAHLMSVFQNRS